MTKSWWPSTEKNENETYEYLCIYSFYSIFFKQEQILGH